MAVAVAGDEWEFVMNDVVMPSLNDLMAAVVACDADVEADVSVVVAEDDVAAAAAVAVDVVDGYEEWEWML